MCHYCNSFQASGVVSHKWVRISMRSMPSNFEGSYELKSPYLFRAFLLKLTGKLARAGSCRSAMNLCLSTEVKSCDYSKL